jgi:hypothetical protein
MLSIISNNSGSGAEGHEELAVAPTPNIPTLSKNSVASMLGEFK